MTTFPDHYAALGIDPTADQEVITAAYRALAKKYHPDTGATAGTASPERFEQIQQAYEVLRTPESRHRYDLELLAATERELAERLAAKRRVVPYGAAPQEAPPPPPPDLGDIRPEPAVRRAIARPKPRRQVAPFLVPVILLLAIAGGGAWLFLPKSPDAPPLPEAQKSDVAVAPPKAAPAPSPEPAPAPAQPPLFGSTGAAEPAGAVQVVTAAPTPTPAASTQLPEDRPLFGSSLDDEAALSPVAEPVEDVAADPPPVPKLRPANPARPAQPQPARQVQPQPDAQEPEQEQAQARPRLQRMAQQGPYRLVIFQRQPGGEATAWSAGLLFESQGRCVRFGVKTVLRRLASQPGADRGDIWYECQPSGGMQ